MPKPLTPDALIYESFRISQGDAELQDVVLWYVSSEFDIEIPRVPSAELKNRVERFLDGSVRTGSRTHVNHVIDDPDPLTHKVVSELTSTLATQHGMYRQAADAVGTSQERYDGHATLRKLTTELIGRETEQFDTVLHNDSSQQEIDIARRRRYLARHAAGRLSFIHYHGVEQHTTGYDELDTLYERIAGQYASPVLHAERQSHLHALGNLAGLFELWHADELRGMQPKQHAGR